MHISQGCEFAPDGAHRPASSVSNSLERFFWYWLSRLEASNAPSSTHQLVEPLEGSLVKVRLLHDKNIDQYTTSLTPVRRQEATGSRRDISRMAQVEHKNHSY